MIINDSTIDTLIGRDGDIPIIITSYHRPKTFIKCVNSVLKATSRSIYIIDNSGGKINQELSKYNHINRIKIIKNAINIGKPQSINKHFDAINPGRWFVTMDPDVVVPKDGIDHLINKADELIEKGYPIALLCPPIENDKSDWQNQLTSRHMKMHQWSEMYQIEKDVYINTSLAGCIMIVNTNFFEKIGRFNTEKLYNDDDGYLCNLSKMNNMINVICNDVKCMHDESENIQGYIKWKQRNFYDKKDDRGFWD
jgi:GT2 family glycosyltransferase